MAGVAVAVTWMAVWALLLRAFGFPILCKSSEERATRKERILAMGKWRYVLTFGVLGMGFALGLGNVVASIMEGSHFSWMPAGIQLALWMVFCGLWNGVMKWNQTFRAEVPFPPSYPPQT